MSDTTQRVMDGDRLTFEMPSGGTLTLVADASIPEKDPRLLDIYGSMGFKTTADLGAPTIIIETMWVRHG